MKKQYLWFELLGIFFLAPLLFYFEILDFFKIFALIGLMVFCIVVLKLDKRFKFRDHFLPRKGSMKTEMPVILIRFFFSLPLSWVLWRIW